MSLSQANRGQGLERYLDELHALYRSQGRACVFRTPPPVKLLRRLDKGQFVAVHLSEGPPDYTGFVGGRAVCFDAKECKDARWPFSHLPEHQADAFDAAQAQGAWCFIYLRLRGADFVLPWAGVGPRWRAWHEAKARAVAGSASLSTVDCYGLGWLVTGKGWLVALPISRSTPMEIA